MKRDTEKNVTLEDLLRLKRAERPPAEFWTSFEAEIRVKQLSAIVSRRPWWDRFSKVFAMVNRHQVSFGAAAAFAMAFAGFRYVSGQPEATKAPQTATPVPAVALAAAAAPVRPAPVIVPAVASPHDDVVVAMNDVSPVPAPRHVIAASASHMTPAPVAAAPDSLSKSPFVDGLSVKLADFREPVSDYTRPSVFGSDREFEAAPASSRQLVSDPLAHMDPAAERRARLLSPALPAYSSENSRALASDWIRQRSSPDDRMYESMDRGSNDDRMLVGFRF
jgi:hypothetical protein